MYVGIAKLVCGVAELRLQLLKRLTLEPVIMHALVKCRQLGIDAFIFVAQVSARHQIAPLQLA